MKLVSLDDWKNHQLQCSGSFNCWVDTILFVVIILTLILTKFIGLSGVDRVAIAAAFVVLYDSPKLPLSNYFNFNDVHQQFSRFENNKKSPMEQHPTTTYPTPKLLCPTSISSGPFFTTFPALSLTRLEGDKFHRCVHNFVSPSSELALLLTSSARVVLVGRSKQPVMHLHTTLSRGRRSWGVALNINLTPRTSSHSSSSKISDEPHKQSRGHKFRNLF